jgi:hypothetical protein
VLETVTLVLERARKPMRAREIHVAAEQLAGEPLLWTSVKAALSADTKGDHPRFRRVRHGVYQLSRDVGAAPVEPPCPLTALAPHPRSANR